MKHNIPKPHGSDKDYIQFEGYWIPLGTLEQSVPEDYILTKSVKKNLKDLVRIVSIGQLPVLLQVREINDFEPLKYLYIYFFVLLGRYFCWKNQFNYILG